MKDDTYTLRDRDSMGQVRASEDEIVNAILNLTVSCTETWDDVAKRLPKFEGQELDEK